MITYRYGNVYLQLARTAELLFSQERDPFGVDSMYTTYIIRVKGFLATSQGLFPGVGTTAITAVTLNQVKAELETPRLSMEYQIAGQVIVSVASGSIDAKIGPEPLPCRITEVNTGTFMVECGCIVRVVDCASICAGGNNPILSLRWTQTESFDENWYSNLTTDGHLIVRSDLLRSADGDDPSTGKSFRALCTPPLLLDYIRTESKYTLSPDGLMLNFHFNDVERDRLPPFPATKAKGTYTVETPQPGFNRFGTVNLRLEGQKGTSRKALLIKACAMAYSKLQSDQLLTAPAHQIWGRFVEDLFEPAIDITMTARMTPIQAKGFIEGGGTLTTGQAALIGGIASGLLLGPSGLLVGIESGLIAKTAADLADFLGGGKGSAIAAGVTAVGGGAADAAKSFAALVMPSVGQDTEGLKSGQPGIAPPDRKRIAGLLTALFRDPCLCLETTVELRTNTNPPTSSRNPAIVNTTELTTIPSINATTSSVIEIGKTIITELTTGGVGLLHDTAPYDTYQIETTTTMDTGNIHMPGTGVGHDGGVSAVVTGHGGLMQVITSWVAGRTGKPPQLPTFESPDPNVVPLYGSVVAKDAVPNVDGSAIVYMIAGYYVHAIKDPKLHQIAPAVAPFFDEQVRTAAAEGASFWTNTALWTAASGVVGGLVLTSNAAPLIPDGVETAPQPHTPPGFDLSNLTGDQLNSIIQTGSANPGGQTPSQDFFYNPPVKP